MNPFVKEVRNDVRGVLEALALLSMLAAPASSWADVAVSLTAPTNGSTHAPSTNITLAADATATQAYTVSKVEFFNGATLIGSDTNSPYGITWNNVPQGSYTLTAKATAIKKGSPDQTAISSPVSIAVTVPPSVNLTSPADGARFGMLENITVSATASDTDGTIAKVTLIWTDELSFDGGSSTVTEPPYSVVATMNPHPGIQGSWDYPVYRIYAIATDNNGANTVSNDVMVTVGPSVTITSPAIGANYTTPANIPLSASVVSPNGGGEIARVEFYHGSTLIGAVWNSPYNLNWQNVSVGIYSLTAKSVSLAGSVWTSPAVNVAVTEASTEGSLYFVHVDHLNTPRLVADTTGTTVWRWNQAEPFGNNPADEDPDANSVVFDLPLRLPGQRYDEETGLHYNDFRDYFPEIGRYVESDPIGLRGGLNTYAYVQGSPVAYVDPSGLDVKVCHFPGGPTHIGFGVGSLSTNIQTSGFYPQKHRTPVGTGTIKNDDLSEPGAQCKGAVTTPKQDDCLTRCQKRYENDPGRYHFLRRNCSNYVYTCLRECGLPPGADSFWPKTLYDSVSGTPIPATGIPIFYP